MPIYYSTWTLDSPEKMEHLISNFNREFWIRKCLIEHVQAHRRYKYKQKKIATKLTNDRRDFI